MTIKQIQCLLYYLGYYNGMLDGIWGEKSQRATIDFQRDFAGLPVDGICGDQTEKALKHSVAYGIGKKSDSTDCTADYTNVQNNNTENSTDGNTGTFWDEIEYFDRSEFKCKCGGKYCKGYPGKVRHVVCTDSELLQHYIKALELAVLSLEDPVDQGVQIYR